jgi:L-alanine-DL-glutamate epimerase-like enolase superfamily enzyme
MITIIDVQHFLVQVPFVESVRRDMERANIHEWSEVEITRVETSTGVVGWGETIQHYTWRRASDHKRVIGASPFDILWDDSLGAGLQMAVLDAAGKCAGVPVYRLFGQKCREWCAISFWDHDMSPENYAAQARIAVELGYTCIKIKTRPWWDVRETIRAISDATPDHFRIDADWNAFLNHAGTAIPVLRELEQTFPKIKMYEDPIGRNDASGNRHLRTQIETPIAHHYGAIPPREAVEMGVCDGWILNMGAGQTMREGSTAAELKMPFFLQMVGTGLTTALSLHFSAVLTQAQWPTITCHELYEHCLLTERIPVTGGYAQVPERPGLGVEIDEDALATYRVVKADHSVPRRLIKVTRPGGVNIYFAETRQKWVFYGNGNQPVDEWGTQTELIDDDGGAGFDDLFKRATGSPVITGD